MTIDLSSFAEKTDAVGVELKNPKTGEVLADDKGNVAKVFLYGKASKRFNDYQKAKVNQILKEKSVKKGNTEEEQTFEKLNESVLEALLVCVDRFEGLAYEGKAIDNETVVKAVLTNPSFKWLLDQTQDAVNNQANFF